MSADFLEAAFKKYQTFILPILAVIVALALFVAIVIPQGLKIPDTNNQIQKSQTDLQALNTKESILETVDTQKFQNDINTTFQALPQDADIAGVFNQVLLSLNTNGLSLDDISISQTPAANANTLTDYLLKISSTGTTADFQNFINQTKQLPRVIKVEAFDSASGGSTTGSFGTTVSTTTPVVPKATGGNLQTLEIQITIQTFYQGVPPTQTLQTDAPLTLPTNNDEQLISQIQNELNALPALSSESAVSLPSGKTDPFQ